MSLKWDLDLDLVTHTGTRVLLPVTTPPPLYRSRTDDPQTPNPDPSPLDPGLDSARSSGWSGAGTGGKDDGGDRVGGGEERYAPRGEVGPPLLGRVVALTVTSPGPGPYLPSTTKTPRHQCPHPCPPVTSTPGPGPGSRGRERGLGPPRLPPVTRRTHVSRDFRGVNRGLETGGRSGAPRMSL